MSTSSPQTHQHHCPFVTDDGRVMYRYAPRLPHMGRGPAIAAQSVDPLIRTLTLADVAAFKAAVPQADRTTYALAFYACLRDGLGWRRAETLASRANARAARPSA